MFASFVADEPDPVRVNDNNQNDRNDFHHMRSGIFITTCACALALFVFGVYVLVQTPLKNVLEHNGNEIALENGVMFEEVVRVSPGKFDQIRCFLDTSIDETFHCRFAFTDLADLQPIIDANELIPHCTKAINLCEKARLQVAEECWPDVWLAASPSRCRGCCDLRHLPGWSLHRNSVG